MICRKSSHSAGIGTYQYKPWQKPPMPGGTLSVAASADTTNFTEKWLAAAPSPRRSTTVTGAPPVVISRVRCRCSCSV